MEVNRDSFVWRLANCNVLKTEFWHPVLDCNSKWCLSFRIQLLNDIKREISYLHPCKPSVVSPLKVVSFIRHVLFIHQFSNSDCSEKLSLDNYVYVQAKGNRQNIHVFIIVIQHQAWHDCVPTKVFKDNTSWPAIQPVPLFFFKAFNEILQVKTFCYKQTFNLDPKMKITGSSNH